MHCTYIWSYITEIKAVHTKNPEASSTFKPFKIIYIWKKDKD